MHEEEIIKTVVQKVLQRLPQEKAKEANKDMASDDRVLYCNYSNRHCHVSKEALEALFGLSFELTKLKDLIQPGEYASEQVITMVGPRGDTLPVRILGPVRSKTQVEISRTDSFALHIKNVPIRESGDVAGSPGVVLVGPKGAYNLAEGVIIAKRHIHMTTDDAFYFGVENKQVVKVKVDSPDRSLIFDDVIVRVKDSYALEMHIDNDEANAAGIGNMTPVKILKD